MWGDRSAPKRPLRPARLSLGYFEALDRGGMACAKRDRQGPMRAAVPAGRAQA